MKRAVGLIALLLSVLWNAQITATDFLVETNSGKVIKGEWAGTSASGLKLKEGTDVQTIPFDQVVGVKPANGAMTANGPPMSVSLIGGSVVAAADLAIDQGQLRIEPRRQEAIEIPIREVRAIRFRLGTPATDPEWLGLVEKGTRSDLMVIRRGNGQLDPIEGVVVGLNAQELKFELDGDAVEAPLTRLEGVLFGSAERDARTAKVKIRDVFGSTFLAGRLEPSGRTDQVEVMLPGEVKHQIPLEQIEQMTWASGRVLLAGQKAAELSMQTRVPTGLPADLVRDWFGPVTDGDDLIATAGGVAEYRVEKGFQTLAGSVGRDPQVAVGGKTQVRILVDGEVAWDEMLDGAGEKGFRVPVSGALRIRLEVLAGDDGDLGDQVRFYKPRLLK